MPKSALNWNKEEITLYIQRWKVSTGDEMSLLYGVTRRTILTYNKQLGLKKNHQDRSQIAKAHYKPQMSEKRAFAPRTPHNLYQVGEVSFRSNGKILLPYIQTEKGMIRLHLYNWAKENGEVSKDMIICFRDRNPANCEIENLYLISRKEACRLMTGVRKSVGRRRKIQEEKQEAERQRMEKKKTECKVMQPKEKVKRIYEKRIRPVSPEVIFYREAKKKAREERDRIKLEERKERDRQRQEARMISEATKYNQKFRRNLKPFKSLQRDFSKLIPVKIDHKTTVYVKTREEIETVKARYSAINHYKQAV